MPRKVCKSARLVEGSMLLMASILYGSGLTPLELLKWPKNGISLHLNLHLSALKWRPVSRACYLAAFRFALWSARSQP